jgi:hypothetical protein
VVLTGETEAMQAFIEKHVNEGDAWNEMYGNSLVKIASGPGSK